MEWILCFQTPSGGIKYFTSDLDTPVYLPFKKFLQYIDQFKLMEISDFLEQLDKFKTIFIDIENRTWSIYEQERDSSVPFMDLYSYNEKRKQNEAIEQHDSYGVQKNNVGCHSPYREANQSNQACITDSHTILPRGTHPVHNEH